MHPLLVLDVVGLTPELIGAHTPNLARFAARRDATVAHGHAGGHVQRAGDDADRCARGHGVVGNGWFSTSTRSGSGASRTAWSPARRSGTRAGRDPAFTCAKLFWWWNMASAVDCRITPRPFYRPTAARSPTATRSRPSCATSSSARSAPFPLLRVLGAGAGLASTPLDRATRRRTSMRDARPTLTLVYLPHLDYDLQRFGPDDRGHRSRTSREIDAVAGELIDAAAARGRRGGRRLRVRHRGRRPAGPHQPRAARGGAARRARRAGRRDARPARSARVRGRRSPDRARLRRRHERACRACAALLERCRASSEVLDEADKRAHGLDHPRAGELVAIAGRTPGSPTTTGSTTRARPTSPAPSTSTASPATTRSSCSSIPRSACPKLAIGWRLRKQEARHANLMDVIPLDASLVRGSHGRADTTKARRSPVVISSNADLLPRGE